MNGVLEYPMERMVLVSVLLVVPGMALIYLAARLMAVAVKLFRTGHVVESLLLLVAALVTATLVAVYGNEKTILVAALLSWVFLAAAFIRFVLRNGENDPRQQSYFADPQHDQDPNSLNFSGVGPGFQGFGMYAHGVRVGNEPIEDDK
jgi:Ca2+/Na+ antiporter